MFFLFDYIFFCSFFSCFELFQQQFQFCIEYDVAYIPVVCIFAQPYQISGYLFVFAFTDFTQFCFVCCRVQFCLLECSSNKIQPSHCSPSVPCSSFANMIAVAMVPPMNGMPMDMTLVASRCWPNPESIRYENVELNEEKILLAKKFFYFPKFLFI